MSIGIPSLPREMVDAIIDHLHHDREALKNCCLVSKEWVPRTQKHLFKDKTITFKSVQDAVAWSQIFPDPTKPPASYSRSLALRCARSITNGYFSRNPNIVKLIVLDCQNPTHQPGSCHAPLNNLLPNVKSLKMHLVCSLKAQEVFDLLCSFPRLEDLLVINTEFINFDGNGAIPRPSSPPPLTGTLTLSSRLQIGLPRLLVELPIDLRFRKIVERHSYDIEGLAKLVDKCSSTLECIDIRFTYHGSVDLSKATKLKKVQFRFSIHDGHTAEQAVKTLGTITGDHKDFKWVMINITMCKSETDYFAKQKYGGIFRAIDSALFQLRERRSSPFCIKLVWDGLEELRQHFTLEHLLPKVMEKRDIGLDLEYRALDND